MLKIYKYKIEITDEFTLFVPGESKILKLDVQNNKPVLWILVDPDSPQKIRHFKGFGTGHPIQHKNILSMEHHLVYIDTVMMEGGFFVYHLFEKRFNNGSLQRKL
ncbi:MAG: hypothetical protein PVI90_02470 [Desulfobacteraceae bacterium]|jgi:hypothetical protein